MKRRHFPDDPWFYATFEGARIASLLKTCDLPFSEKLDFIDEAFALFRRSADDPKQQAVGPKVAESPE